MSRAGTEVGEIAASFTELEQLRGALRAHHQGILSGTNDSLPEKARFASALKIHSRIVTPNAIIRASATCSFSPDPDLAARDGAVRCRSRLGGMLNYYDRAA